MSAKEKKQSESVTAILDHLEHEAAKPLFSSLVTGIKALGLAEHAKRQADKRATSALDLLMTAAREADGNLPAFLEAYEAAKFVFNWNIDRAATNAKCLKNARWKATKTQVEREKSRFAHYGVKWIAGRVMYNIPHTLKANAPAVADIVAAMSKDGLAMKSKQAGKDVVVATVALPDLKLVEPVLDKETKTPVKGEDGKPVLKPVSFNAATTAVQEAKAIERKRLEKEAEDRRTAVIMADPEKLAQKQCKDMLESIGGCLIDGTITGESNFTTIRSGLAGILAICHKMAEGETIGIATQGMTLASLIKEAEAAKTLRKDATG